MGVGAVVAEREERDGGFDWGRGSGREWWLVLGSFTPQVYVYQCIWYRTDYTFSAYVGKAFTRQSDRGQVL